MITETKRLRATVHIRGAMDQHFYGTNVESLRRRAIKALTQFEPGGGNLFPDRIVISEQVRVISGRLAQWEPVFTLFYKEVPETQHEWRKRKQ